MVMMVGNAIVAALVFVVAGSGRKQGGRGLDVAHQNILHNTHKPA
jgi:hypothetical protein